MSATAWLLLLANLSVAWCLNSFLVQVPASDQTCFYEQLKTTERFDLSYQVIDGGNYDVDFMILKPDQSELYSALKQSTATFGFEAPVDGEYRYCFSNKFSSVSRKIVTFSVHGPEEKKKFEERIQNSEPNHEGVQKELWALSDTLSSAHDEQTYLVFREGQHRDIASSTRSRIMWWSMIQSAVLIAVCIFQANYLKK